MSKSAVVTLTVAGSDTGPYFDIYSNADCYLIPLVENVAKTDLVSGYVLKGIPDHATRVRVKSKDVCLNFVDIILTTP